ncbi:hypothetical protein LOAG_17200 [Loa loa]|uniref:Uncharacterized protein n=1 Tax=Loa loa TaxID=7209 RepID=A0A1S0UJE7_LOALO|nr:hypothetical protein LOAG_17200 [Loa loa]EJD75705.1 hypothetical protein LOAG_17200 [Loa loa]
MVVIIPAIPVSEAKQCNKKSRNKSAQRVDNVRYNIMSPTSQLTHRAADEQYVGDILP